MDIESFFKNQDIKRWMKWGGAIVVAIWIVREIFMMTMFHSLFSFVTGGINNQEEAMKSMHQRAEVHMQNVENGMRGVVNGIQAGAEEMSKKLEKMQKDFEKAGEVEEELKHAFEDFEKSSDETTKQMFAKIDRDSKAFEEESKKIWKQWEDDNKKRALVRRKQYKKEWEAKRKEFHDKTGTWLPTYEENEKKHAL